MAVSAEALQTWIAAVEEGYVAPGAWVPWAERAIESASYVWPWLVDLFEAETPERASGALYAGLQALDAGWPFRHASLRIGFLWLRYEREDLAAEQVLERAGQIADINNGVDVPECEAFFCFLDEICGDGPALPSALSLNLRIAALFAPHADLARACLVHLDEVSVTSSSAY